MADVQVIGINEAKRALAEIAAEAPAMAKRAIRAGAAQLGEGMERRAPRLSDELEGTLPRSIRMRDAGVMAVDVGTSHGLADVVEHGGEITPRRAEYLWFMGDRGEVFARRVTMPAQPFIRPAVDEDRVRAAVAVKRSASKSMRRVRG